ncbi:DUF2281 domain-containing protein [Cyanobacterium aponinum AL20118]|uniref:DUF2281 domain-containing protein n=2 Tax=Cyanobacterium aponinum TaxID=379064 RepID=A0A844GVX0_9CHRO|nr:DUF2281 domain-containing protein [Cyanobacterium aponinum]MBD2393429.1 DUF2281 domain-containing protein [Cyanobacterium aponinum FACHB-4101]MTF39009.1 DUF2281 domain-containing protein [Cyanobacterium aponinum 0216]PHV62420.1 hypothetical protein CSQ80_10590 [Cyanobacterium aponinum IPPAS B-1201]WPF89679.1 DUF2281 domain-containing protein [Cyanobacterium aponinum AL20115]
MTLEQLLISKFQTLSPHRKQELLDFAEFLAQKSDSQPPFKSIRGMCADLKLELTEEDIQEVRREMWENFPREDLLS